MSNGYIPVHVTIIDEGDLSKLCPETYHAFFKVMADFNLDEARIFLVLDGQEVFDGPYETIKAVRTMWDALRTDFERKTMVEGGGHLELQCGYHDPDDGDEDDDINGIYFAVTGVYRITRAGEDFIHLLQNVGYVTRNH